MVPELPAAPDVPPVVPVELDEVRVAGGDVIDAKSVSCECPIDELVLSGGAVELRSRECIENLDEGGGSDSSSAPHS